MAKRTIKPAAGESRVSFREAASAARLVYRDGTTGRFVIVEQNSGQFRERTDDADPFKGVRREKSHHESSRSSLKKR